MLFKTTLAILALALGVAAMPSTLEARDKACGNTSGGVQACVDLCRRRSLSGHCNGSACVCDN
ncbi:hypothetical protein PspLS_09799 [Pyricularia sp. CBS 133598]|nr:hypothetical protein PspLS_09799 [Pyricularia sp. CBS 133598]